MTKHTEGPWIAYKRPEPVGHAAWEVHYGTEAECVAEVVHTEGDARLIAAAPELLAMLIELEEAARQAMAGEMDLSSLAVDRYKARDVIAKATGELK